MLNFRALLHLMSNKAAKRTNRMELAHTLTLFSVEFVESWRRDKQTANLLYKMRTHYTNKSRARVCVCAFAFVLQRISAGFLLLFLFIAFDSLLPAVSCPSVYFPLACIEKSLVFFILFALSWLIRVEHSAHSTLSSYVCVFMCSMGACACVRTA